MVYEKPESLSDFIPPVGKLKFDRCLGSTQNYTLYMVDKDQKMVHKYVPSTDETKYPPKKLARALILQFLVKHLNLLRPLGWYRCDEYDFHLIYEQPKYTFEGYCKVAANDPQRIKKGFSLVKDLVKGITFLHSCGLYHGVITESNLYIYQVRHL